MQRYLLALKFPLLCQLFFLLPICFNALYSLSLNMHIKSASQLKHYGEGIVVTRKLPFGVAHLNNIIYNIKFVHDCLVASAITIILTLSGILLIISGDVHPNPGQVSTPSQSTLLKRIKGTPYYFPYSAVLTTQSLIPS